ncbi:MAG: BlaI/MecI/CopY family transcriptional regulator [Planctomycetales bacterium]|jgi:BlaI family penicillinase repressor|nr:BlaI/MecI/CopY family transcriptional regulator [Planctomycetales bacterium]
MSEKVNPTERELEILKVLWDRGEATVRDVYEELRQRLPIVQNTVQAFLRTMEDKGLVTHRLEGRTFIYQPTYERQQTTQRLAEQLLTRAFDGAMDQLVQSVLSLRQPTKDELARLEQLLAEAKANKGKSSRK